MDKYSLGLILSIIILTFSFVLVVCIVYLIKFKQTKKLLMHSQAEVHSLSQKAESLNKYQAIADAEAEAERIRSQAAEIKRKSTLQAEAVREKAAKEVEQIKWTSAQQAASIKQEATKKAEEIVNQAREKAGNVSDEYNRIIAIAKQEAEKIAGDAIKAKGKADQYEKAIRAMKNIIEGYGDEYIIPSRSLLDDLADDFGYKAAGVELKGARKKTRDMVARGLAADCDYVEQNRRNLAVRFVLDAFNGKVDTALAKVKHDNFGKIKQEILDAFELVNHNGAAFREARILRPYLDARLNELKWAVSVFKLQVEEREEQRRIKEAIREEERAKREFEKAIREAEKEEKMLQKAMQKAREQLAAASEEQKLQYEQQIQELEVKLVEAEEKNQKAISMAQQTKRGHVYIISNLGSFGDDVCKIGLTRRLEPLDRVKELGDASVPFPFDVHAMIYSEDAPSLENELHKLFDAERMNKVNYRKEFFRAPISEVRKAIEAQGVESHWTMKAEAAEYRETLAQEAALRSVKENEQPGKTEFDEKRTGAGLA